MLVVSVWADGGDDKAAQLRRTARRMGVGADEFEADGDGDGDGPAP